MTSRQPPGLIELRRYRAVAGRGDRLADRFAAHTLALFSDHGFRVLTIGRDLEDRDRLYYALAWRDRDQMDRAWTAFVADERWIAVRDESERDGALVEGIDRSFLDPLRVT